MKRIDLELLFTGIKEGAKEGIQVSILTNGQGQEDIIKKWLKDKTYISKTEILPYFDGSGTRLFPKRHQ